MKSGLELRHELRLVECEWDYQTLSHLELANPNIKMHPRDVQMQRNLVKVLAKKKGTKNTQIAGDFKRQFSVDKNIIKFKKQKLRSNSTK